MIVTTGAQQALDLLIRSEVLPGQPVAVEDPTYPGCWTPCTGRAPR